MASIVCRVRAHTKKWNTKTSYNVKIADQRDNIAEA